MLKVFTGRRRQLEEREQTEKQTERKEDGVFLSLI